jgi:hypothetical protein
MNLKKSIILASLTFSLGLTSFAQTFVSVENFETGAISSAAFFDTKGGGGDGGPVAPTTSISAPGLSSSNFSYQAVHGNGTYNFSGELNYAFVVANIDLSNPLLQVTVRYDRTVPGTGTYNSLRLVGNTDVSNSFGGYGTIGTDIALGGVGATVTGTYDLSAYIAAINAGSGGTYNTLRFILNKNADNNGTLFIDNINITSAAPIPEPSTFAALAGVGVLGLAAMRRRRA